MRDELWREDNGTVFLILKHPTGSKCIKIALPSPPVVTDSPNAKVRARCRCSYTHISVFEFEDAPATSLASHIKCAMNIQDAKRLNMSQRFRVNFRFKSRNWMIGFWCDRSFSAFQCWECAECMYCYTVSKWVKSERNSSHVWISCHVHRVCRKTAKYLI